MIMNITDNETYVSANKCYILKLNKLIQLKGRGCSAAVEHSPHYREVEGSILAKRWAFFLLSSLFLFFYFLSDFSVIIKS